MLEIHRERSERRKKKRKSPRPLEGARAGCAPPPGSASDQYIEIASLEENLLFYQKS